LFLNPVGDCPRRPAERWPGWRPATTAVSGAVADGIVALSRREDIGETLARRKVLVFGTAHLAYVAGLIWTAT
jgi:hypothetical protein